MKFNLFYTFFDGRFIKVAKDVHRDFGKYGDERCNQLLRQELELSSEIWLPNK